MWFVHYRENCVWIHSFILLLHIFVWLISLFWRAVWVFSPFVSLVYIPSCWKTSIFIGKIVFTWVRIIVKCMFCLKLNIESWWQSLGIIILFQHHSLSQESMCLLIITRNTIYSFFLFCYIWYLVVTAVVCIAVVFISMLCITAFKL